MKKDSKTVCLSLSGSLRHCHIPSWTAVFQTWLRECRSSTDPRRAHRVPLVFLALCFLTINPHLMSLGTFAGAPRSAGFRHQLLPSLLPRLGLFRSPRTAAAWPPHIHVHIYIYTKAIQRKLGRPKLATPCLAKPAPAPGTKEGNDARFLLCCHIYTCIFPPSSFFFLFFLFLALIFNPDNAYLRSKDKCVYTSHRGDIRDPTYSQPHYIYTYVFELFLLSLLYTLDSIDIIESFNIYMYISIDLIIIISFPILFASFFFIIIKMRLKIF